MATLRSCLKTLREIFSVFSRSWDGWDRNVVTRTQSVTNEKEIHMQKRLGTLLLCITAVMALLAMSAVPALAHHKDDHDGGQTSESSETNYQEADQAASDNDGDADSDSSTAYDEDSDTNDGTANNVEDDGD